MQGPLVKGAGIRLLTARLAGRPFDGSILLKEGATSVDGVVVANPLQYLLHARVGLRDAMQPLFADGWLVTDVDRNARTYTLSR